jgi:hypothetical protein
MLIRRRRFALASGLVGVLLPFCTWGEGINCKDIVMISNDSEERGKELRSSLEHECARLRDTKTLRPGPLGNDVANVVAEYIPVGTAFSDAESSLRSAGFTVYPRPSANPPGNRPDRFAVEAIMDTLYRSPAYNVQAIVVLNPPSPGDYSRIASISAGLFVISM